MEKQSVHRHMGLHHADFLFDSIYQPFLFYSNILLFLLQEFYSHKDGTARKVKKITNNCSIFRKLRVEVLKLVTQAACVAEDGLVSYQWQE